MNQKTLLKSGALAIAGFAATSAFAASWTGSTGNWTDDSWGLAGGSPGDALNPGVEAKMEGSDDVVTVNTVIANEVGFTRVNTGAVLNVATGGSLTVKSGSSVDVQDATINVTGGTFNTKHTVEFGRQLVSGETAALNVSAGTFSLTSVQNTSQFQLRNNSNLGTGTVSVSGTGSFVGTSGRDISHTDLLDFTMSLSDSATLNMVATSGSSNWDMAGDADVVGLSHTFSITGSSVTAAIDTIQAFSTVASQEAVFKFTADGSGFSTFDVGTLTLNGGDHAADLIVDLSGLTTGSFDLFSYDSLVGSAFNSVSFINGSATLDYGIGTSDTISISVIPEPGTYALLAGLLGLSFVMMRRRQA